MSRRSDSVSGIARRQEGNACVTFRACRRSSTNVDANDRSPFAEWFEELDAEALARVTVALVRLGEGKLGNTKGVGSGVLEYRIDFGPGYRVYFGRDGDALIILLAGDTKRRQQRDIDSAKQRWQEYKARKRGK